MAKQIYPWNNGKPFIAVDLDRTLARLTSQDINNGKWKTTYIGPAIPRMLKLVKKWIKEGKEVKIFTTRLQYGKDAQKAVRQWLIKYGLGDLEIINKKDHMMVAIFDDLSVPVESNTGKLLKNYKTWAWKKYFREK